MTEAFIYAAPFVLAVAAAWDHARRVTALKREQLQASADLAKGSVADLRNSVMGLSAQCAELMDRVSSYESSSERAWESIESLRESTGDLHNKYSMISYSLGEQDKRNEAQAAVAKRVADLEKNQIELGRRLDGSPKLSKFAR